MVLGPERKGTIDQNPKPEQIRISNEENVQNSAS
jgi:hypothetical protein